jgi:hypothetical protein
MTKNWHEDFEDEPGCEEDGFYFEEPTYEQLTGEPEIDDNYSDPSDPGEIRQKLVSIFHVVGNKNYAFALNITDSKDHHYFTRDPDVNDDAFIRACGWAYEPPPNREFPLL